MPKNKLLIKQEEVYLIFDDTVIVIAPRGFSRIP